VDQAIQVEQVILLLKVLLKVNLVDQVHKHQLTVPVVAVELAQLAQMELLAEQVVRVE
tara:strand:- start:89 stop:262 length:174 start_codon:yes stop_codon:yes gene_type:complete